MEKQQTRKEYITEGLEKQATHEKMLDYSSVYNFIKHKVEVMKKRHLLELEKAFEAGWKAGGARFYELGEIGSVDEYYNEQLREFLKEINNGL